MTFGLTRGFYLAGFQCALFHQALEDLVLTALKRYMKDPSSNKAKLLEYAGLFKIRDIVMRYMELFTLCPFRDI